MKYVLTSLALVIGFAVTAQENLGMTQNTTESLKAGSNALQAHGASTLFFNPSREVEGRTYLFEDWENTAIIHTNDDQKFVLRNINLNLKRNTFESKISKDSLFSFNFNNIDKFVINNRVFKNYYWDDDNRVYQVIYEDDKFQILKAFELILVEGSANPMVNRSRDRYVTKDFYYLRQDNKIKPFKLSKSRVLKLVDGNKEKLNKILEYSKTYRLSFKDDHDVQKILEYSAKN